MTAGGIGAFIGCPADLILIRMQTDNMLPEAERRNYKGIGDAFRRIPAEEGFTSLWKGGVPTAVRAMALNGTLFSTYEEIKENLFRIMPNNKNAAWLISGLSAGSLAAFASLPFDNAKTKMQKMMPNPDGSMPYKNIFHCIRSTARVNGTMGLWAGFPTYCMRVAPNNMIALVVSEKIKKMIM